MDTKPNVGLAIGLAIGDTALARTRREQVCHCTGAHLATVIRHSSFCILHFAFVIKFVSIRGSAFPFLGDFVFKSIAVGPQFI
jgi:hypothetical protein